MGTAPSIGKQTVIASESMWSDKHTVSADVSSNGSRQQDRHQKAWTSSTRSSADDEEGREEEASERTWQQQQQGQPLSEKPPGDRVNLQSEATRKLQLQPRIILKDHHISEHNGQWRFGQAVGVVFYRMSCKPSVAVGTQCHWS